MTKNNKKILDSANKPRFAIYLTSKIKWKRESLYE